MDKAGNVHRYESVLVRRTYRDGKKVRHETLANLSKLPAEVIAAIEATLKGQALVPAEAACTVTRSLPHGHVAAVAAMARRLGFPGPLGPACRSRDLVLGVDHLAGDPPGLQTVHAVAMGRLHPGARPGRGRRVYR